MEVGQLAGFQTWDTLPDLAGAQEGKKEEEVRGEGRQEQHPDAEGVFISPQ